jgi:hypothetical protein
MSCSNDARTPKERSIGKPPQKVTLRNISVTLLEYLGLTGSYPACLGDDY